MTSKSRLTRKSASRVSKKSFKKNTTRKLTRRDAESALKAIRNTRKFSSLGVYADAYLPGSEKPRFVKSRGGVKLIKPRVTLKGGFTRGQVRLSRKTGSIGIGPLKKNKLGQFGYHTTAPKLTRHKSLDKAVKKYGELSIYRSLNAIAVYNKNTHPENATVAREDRDYIKGKYF